MEHVMPKKQKHKNKINLPGLLRMLGDMAGVEEDLATNEK